MRGARTAESGVCLCLLPPAFFLPACVIERSCLEQQICLAAAQPAALFAWTLRRHIPQTQERILDAPDLVDDYYLNLLDWSCNNVVSLKELSGLLYIQRSWLLVPY